MDHCIKVTDLAKRFSGRTVVNRLSFTIDQGEVFGILGHNGAGKSTTIEMMLGLQIPDAGSATILGKEPRKNRKTLFEQVGVQLQASSYQNNIKVNEVCEETSSLYQNPSDYHTLLEQFGLTAFEHHKVEDLSGGERQKLSLVVALIPNPKVLFLDELTTGLDVSARREVWDMLKQLKEQGMTMVLTTHYMEEAEYLCDRVLILKQGNCMIMDQVDNIIEQTNTKNLEEAYLTVMEENPQ